MTRAALPILLALALAACTPPGPPPAAEPLCGGRPLPAGSTAPDGAVTRYTCREEHLIREERRCMDGCRCAYTITAPDGSPFAAFDAGGSCDMQLGRYVYADPDGKTVEEIQMILSDRTDFCEAAGVPLSVCPRFPLAVCRGRQKGFYDCTGRGQLSPIYTAWAKRLPQFTNEDDRSPEFQAARMAVYVLYQKGFFGDQYRGSIFQLPVEVEDRLNGALVSRVRRLGINAGR